jgi:hypothetical protein
MAAQAQVSGAAIGIAELVVVDEDLSCGMQAVVGIGRMAPAECQKKSQDNVCSHIASPL